MLIFLFDWVSRQPSPTHVLGLLGLLALVAVAILVGKVLCWLVDWVFDGVEARQ